MVSNHQSARGRNETLAARHQIPAGQRKPARHAFGEAEEKIFSFVSAATKYFDLDKILKPLMKCLQKVASFKQRAVLIIFFVL